MMLGIVLQKWRKMQDYNLRDAAKMMGLSAPTLSRIENGETMDGSTLARILTWLMSDPEAGFRKGVAKP